MLLHAPLQVCGVISGRIGIRESHLQQSKALIQLAAQRAAHLLDWRLGPQRERQLIELLARAAAGLPYQCSLYQRLFDRIAPKVLLKEEASYGTSAALIAAARSRGILIAEYQHGAVSSGHDAYNSAPALHADENYRKSLPDYFLGYGQWWNDQINLPIKKIVIGNPHRDAQLERIGERKHEQRDVLILGDGIDTELYLSLAKSVANATRSSNFRTVFRPHPIERAKVKQLHSDQSGVVIDENPDIYQSFLTAYAVVSEQSTGLFEAVGLAECVFLWDTAKSRFGFPRHPFQRFQSAEELVTMILASKMGRLNETAMDAVWAAGWRENYTSFLREHGVTQ
jgi:hypothetical protein